MRKCAYGCITMRRSVPVCYLLVENDFLTLVNSRPYTSTSRICRAPLCKVALMPLDSLLLMRGRQGRRLPQEGPPPPSLSLFVCVQSPDHKSTFGLEQYILIY
jgi:hypothetical protein